MASERRRNWTANATYRLSIVVVICSHLQIFEHIVGYRPVDVLAIQVQGDEHDPRPESDPEVELEVCQPRLSYDTSKHTYPSNKLLLLLSCPRVVRIKPMASLILGFLVNTTPVLSCGRVTEGMVVIRTIYRWLSLRYLGRPGIRGLGNGYLLDIQWYCHVRVIR
jgi:hypothetical protein